ncbi:hypothetical protein [Polynucleobacter sp. Fuers-14]|uniref:hypothetical protein n=1 Tax=Polynucleobacter sp. Fuers-14 TaxID=1758364 RepID=UPI001C0BBF3F|nr:hypothetical protein [Polynucleobacter sp. Fuers-14]MBU3640971.1 hypothetical protein [Polynucleobacter sp. Fuers-14]
MSDISFEWIGSILGIGGAFLVAINGRYASYGWICFLMANMVMIGFAVESGLYGILTQQVVFMATSVIGLWRSSTCLKK